MKVKIKDMHQEVKACLKKYIASLKSYYKKDIETNDIIKIISRKLQEIQVASLTKENEAIVVLTATVKENLRNETQIRYHRVYYGKKTKYCTCEWFSKYRVCKHLLKVYLLHHHGGSFYRRKLSFPDYKANRRSYTTVTPKTG